MHTSSESDQCASLVVSKVCMDVSDYMPVDRFTRSFSRDRRDWFSVSVVNLDKICINACEYKHTQLRWSTHSRRRRQPWSFVAMPNCTGITPAYRLRHSQQYLSGEQAEVRGPQALVKHPNL